MSYEADFAALPRAARYKLLCGLVIPRPIALITTLAPGGHVNAAPFSFFNVIADEPPLLLVSIDQHTDGRDKDTAANIERSGEFVVHLVEAQIADQMHGCAEPVGAEVSEMAEVGFTALPSVRVAPPRIAEAPVAFECRLERIVILPSRRLVLGEVLFLHAREGIVDPATYRVDTAAYRPIGRLFANRYATMGPELALADSAYVKAMRAVGRA
jgi:flavin reductase (DIM6/NTAB) family NADH-FMN oxidoreductase RutF